MKKGAIKSSTAMQEKDNYSWHANLRCGDIDMQAQCKLDKRSSPFLLPFKASLARTAKIVVKNNKMMNMKLY
jgi:hypothetical protein